MRIVTVPKLWLSRGKRIAKSPLQRTLTAHIMSRWAKHEGALAHMSLKRSNEMLELQCAQRFPARPTDPDSSVFAELFPAPQPKPSQPNVPMEKAKGQNGGREKDSPKNRPEKSSRQNHMSRELRMLDHNDEPFPKRVRRPAREMDHDNLC